MNAVVFKSKGQIQLSNSANGVTHHSPGREAWEYRQKSRKAPTG